MVICPFNLDLTLETINLVLSAAVLIVFIYNARQITRSANTSEKALEQDRAWVLLDAPEGKHIFTPENLDVNFRFKNFGKTPALNVEIEITIVPEVLDESQAQVATPSAHQKIKPFVLPPNNSIKWVTSLQTPETVVAMQRGIIAMTFIFQISYQTIYGKKCSTIESMRSDPSGEDLNFNPSGEGVAN